MGEETNLPCKIIQNDLYIPSSRRQSSIPYSYRVRCTDFPPVYGREGGGKREFLMKKPDTHDKPGDQG